MQFYEIKSAPFCALTIPLDLYHVQKSELLMCSKGGSQILDIEKTFGQFPMLQWLRRVLEWLALLDFQKR
jgi:hypothetical protein